MLPLYIQGISRDADKKADWLPSPTSGPFNLTVCNQWPMETVPDGTCKAPPTKLQLFHLQAGAAKSVGPTLIIPVR